MNVQTWTRLRRHKLRTFAIEVGNEAVNLLSIWPATGEGRAVKAAAERISSRLDGPQPVRSLKIVFGELDYAIDQLREIAANSFFRREMSTVRVGGKRGGRGMLGHELEQLLDQYAEFRDEQELALEVETKEAIRKVLPAQKLAPVKFVIENGVLRIQEDPAAAAEDDHEIANESRLALLETGEQILNQFLDSNMDKRLGSLVSDLQATLTSEEGIIRCGLKRMILEQSLPAFAEEMPTIVFAQLRSYSAGVGLYVAMFPQWLRFTENAVIADINQHDVVQVYHAGRQLINALERAGPVVNPDVPRTLNWIFEAIRDPKLASKRAVFGAWRTLENLASRLFGACLDWVGAANKGAQLGIKAAAGLAVITLVHSVAATTASIPPKAAQTMQAKWLPEVAKDFLGLFKPD